nr:hypothetical protein [Tanacetum cinerariifolium]
AFLVMADVPEIYMQEFWAIATVHQHSIRFKMDTRKHIFDLESFREMLHISPRVLGQSFTELPFQEEILEFLRHETHISQQGGSGTDEGTGSKPGVPDVPSDDSDEEISWNSFDDEDVDDQTKGSDDKEGENTDESDDDQEETKKVNDDDDDEEEISKIGKQEATESDEATKSDGESEDEETRKQEEESFDPISRTPEDSEDDGNNEEDQGGELASASTSSEQATRSAGRSTTGTQSRQLSASESAFAEEPMQTTCQMEEPSHPMFETDQLDWDNPEGQQYPHNLLQPLPLIPDNRGRRVIPFEHFINNDLEYLWGGASSRKYTTYVTKTKAADYGHIKWIEDLVPRAMWIQEPINYDKHALWGFSHWGRKRQQFYEFAVNRESALDVYSKRRIIAKNRLMRIDELYKFNDGTLNDVRNALDDRLKGIRMQYFPTTIWRKEDKDRAAAMIEAIDKMLKTRRIMRSLEMFVGGRQYEGDFRMLQRTI